MYVNKCIKCGREFETKNPKRVICPDCLYPDKKMIISTPVSQEIAETETKVPPESIGEDQPKFYNSYSAGEGREVRPQRSNYNRNSNYNRPQQGGYNRNNNYNRNNRFNNNQRPQQGGYNRNQRPGGVNNRSNTNRNQRPGFNNNRKTMNKSRGPKQLLVSKEQLEQIEMLYKPMLPLPNPDAHEVIGEKIGLEPRKVFFGINLVRQKMMLPKLPFPKRKLAISPDQMFAIKNLYEPLLPLPPIGCHKIIASQLKMDEWRVHVGIGLIRSQMGLDRWNQEREDAPEEFKKPKSEMKDEKTESGEVCEKQADKPKRGRKPKKEADE